jgi:hypothetical protein
MPISRTRSAQHKVNIPASARENQYLLAKFHLTDEFMSRFTDLIDESSAQPYEKLYQKLSMSFFSINDGLDIESSQFIANDKFPRIRFSPEKLTAQTEQQLLFLYNPRYHFSRSAFFDGAKKAKKITLVFLANGDEVRLNAAKFHQKVKQAITAFSLAAGLSKEDVRVCDHQHLTYDLFAKDKGVEGTQSHKFRPMLTRYSTDDLVLPQTTDTLTYAIVDLPINRRIRELANKKEENTADYNALYNLIADAFINTAKQHNLNNGAVIANGLIPIVRRSDDEIVVANGELQMLGYNPQHTGGGYTCKWNAEKLVDTVQLVFVASEQNKTSHGYGKFLNQIEHALRAFSQQLGYVNAQEEMLVRFHQHIGYYEA